MSLERYPVQTGRFAQSRRKKEAEGEGEKRSFNFFTIFFVYFSSLSYFICNFTTSTE